MTSHFARVAGILGIFVVLGFTIPALAGPSQGRALTFEERVAAQRAIEQVYWSHRIWPQDNPTPKPPLSAVLPESALRAKVAKYLQESNAVEQVWRRPISSSQLQAELDRMARSTRDPAVLRELFAALKNDAPLIAETLGRQALADRLVLNWYAYDDRFHGEIERRAETALASCSEAACMKTLGGRYTETTWKRRNLGATDLNFGATDLNRRATELDHGADLDHGTEPSRAEPSRTEPSRTEPSRAEERNSRDAAGERGRHIVFLDEDEWKSLETRWTGRLESSEARTRQPGDARFAMALGRLGRLEETEDSFSVGAVLSASGDALTTASVVWDKKPFDEWWRSACREFGTAIEAPAGEYAITAPADEGCTIDTWSLLPEGIPARASHTAVWTGTEMIVWGGLITTGGGLASGGRYNPATNIWVETSLNANTPLPRFGHSAVWTGSEMIVWGGEDGSPATTAYSTGGRYDPSTDTWLPTSVANAPQGRRSHAAVWTGSKMIVWGGTRSVSGSVYLSSGGIYDPSSDSWQPTSSTGAPAARANHSAVWTGSQMIVWGGMYWPGGSNPTQYLNSGGRYNPSNNSWSPTSITADTPTGRDSHTPVWTGTQMIVWGGYGLDTSVVNTGGRYDPSSNTWQKTSTGAGVPSPRSRHAAVWTGSVMIVWGGADGTVLDSGARYNPSSDSWIVTSSGTNTPDPRHSASAVWTGTEMLIWGGADAGDRFDSGGRYSPSTNSWLPIPSPKNGTPDARGFHTAVWTGTEMIIWGGIATDDSELNKGGRYTPATGEWEPTSSVGGAPAGRFRHTAVWTGTEMIVWGGYDATHRLDSGGRYNPSTNSWTATARNGAAPSARFLHTSVWTGTEMIIWGGDDEVDFTNSGARYAPGSNSWTAMTTAGAPSARADSSGVWTGAQLIAWGGRSRSGLLNSGGRYSPSSNSWQATSLGAGVPSARLGHGAVWTATRMIVWGGTGVGTVLSTGGLYDPSSDSWVPTSPPGADPGPLSGHSAVWTGVEMIVWGGGNNSTTVNSGGRYNPLSNSWLPTSRGGYVPTPRDIHTAVWTGSGMIVWGGGTPTPVGHWNVVSSGATYCAETCLAPPSIVTNLKFGANKHSITWDAVTNGAPYDIIYGDLQALHSAGVTASTGGCLADNVATPTSDDSDVPAPGQGFWYLSRPRGCGGATGTYNEGGSQIADRDALIPAPPIDCNRP